MNILVIAPHPDDEVLGCGGVMARHVAAGDKVHVLVVTTGHADHFSAEEVGIVKNECRQAHALLGVAKTIHLDFPAPLLDTLPGCRLASAVREVIRQIRPTMIYFPFEDDLHSDHRAVFLATMVASRPLDDSAVAVLLNYETRSETDWAPPKNGSVFIPQKYVDIEAHLDIKLEAMQCYRSQLKEYPHPRSLHGLKALAEFRGSTVRMKAAEAFSVIRELAF